MSSESKGNQTTLTSTRDSVSSCSATVETKRNDAAVHSLFPSTDEEHHSTSISSIAEAIMSYRHRGHRQRNVAVDIVVVVLDVSVNVTQSTANLLVSDPSLETLSNCARIKLKGQRIVSSLVEQNITRSDILRINQLTILTENYHQQSEQQRKATNQRRSQTEGHHQWKVVCELCHSWKHPAASDVVWMRLCSIRNGHANLIASSNEHHQPLPDNMATPPSKIQSLAQWFSQQEPKPSLLMQSQTVKRRCLADIEATSGVLSHVVVQVLSCDTVGVASNSSFLHSSAKQHKPSPFSIVAMITDGSRNLDADIMALHGCKPSWEEQLKRAVNEKVWVRMTNLQSSVCNGHVSLIPTATSVLVPLQARKKGNQRAKTFAKSSGNNDQPSLSRIATQESLPMSLPPDQNCVSFCSPLKDIYIEALDSSLGASRHLSTPSKLFSILIDADGNNQKRPGFRHAILTLKDSSGLFAVQANETIMRILCGSINAAKLLPHRCDNGVGLHVFELVRSLITDKVPLLWELKRIVGRTEESYSVESVTLPEI